LNRVAALQNLDDDDDDDDDISRVCESICENIKASAIESLGYYVLKQHKPWFGEKCSKLLDQRRLAKVQWLQIPIHTNGSNLNNVGHETSRTFRRKKREYLKEKINDLETNSKNKNIRGLYRGINVCKKGYQPGTNIVKDKNGDLVAVSHGILNK
jgi:hypothetical protein